eukprot:Unigene8915_Nuclearia_a/m.27273 Unigene8915_Nuclearia_a/g.27273  ORF Unigene8915_Nuclearia_a/g.27273 Unigene8915_Nuclearia_a/m.27273 type:complete len:261 (+) Unigene8915_Nuclearia_a:704-1486(+)
MAASGLLQLVIDELVDVLVRHDPAELPTMLLCMKVLEYSTLLCAPNQDAVTATPTLVGRLVAFVADHASDVRAVHGLVRLLVNLTNGNDNACAVIGAHAGALDTLRDTVFRMSERGVPPELQFDWYSLGVGLLVNLVERDTHNRAALCATDASLAQVVDEFKVLHAPAVDDADKQAEINARAAYSALLLGFLCIHNRANEDRIVHALGGGPEAIEALVAVLMQFLQIHRSLGVLTDHRAFDEVIAYLYGRLRKMQADAAS